MLKFLEANLRPPEWPVGQAIKDFHHELFRTNTKLAFGMNWIRSDGSRAGQTVIWHNGATDGFASFLRFTEDGNTGVLILSNVSESLDELGMNLLRELAGMSNQPGKSPPISRSVSN